MTRAHQPSLDFEAAEQAAEAGEALVLDLDGFEGPLHVLLALARAQKVDLLQLSVLQLAEQYAAFVRQAQERRFALAADYLVMASWLAYLKSRLLLPQAERPRGEEPPAEVVAEALSFRLAKLDAMRRAGEALQALPQRGRDVFGRGDPEAVTIVASRAVEATLHDLLRALVEQRAKAARTRYRPPPPEAYPLDDARERLRRLLPALSGWTSLRAVAPFPADAGPSRASCLASTLAASLELVKEGALDAEQAAPFADLRLRRRRASPAAIARGAAA